MTLQTLAPEISSHVDVVPSGGSSVRRPGSEDPHRRERKLFIVLLILFVLQALVAVYVYFEEILHSKIAATRNLLNLF